jgi:hypothetical protein
MWGSCDVGQQTACAGIFGVATISELQSDQNAQSTR